MQALMNSGLFGGGLTPVATPELVQRYNDCLVVLGISPTSLKQFRVDGIGWSPEIALERENDYYLSAGVANPMGVIVTPEQRGKPLYHPYNSYDRDLMELYFTRFHQAIADITAIRYIGLDFDQELSSYESPSDLALVESVTLRSIAGGLFDAGREQRQLVEQFRKDDLSWMDAGLRQRIIASGQAWGDLRFIRTEIPDTKFEVRSFHTSALGGVFVFRPRKGKRALLILENPPKQPLRSPQCDFMHLNDTELLPTLIERGIAEVNVQWYERHPEVLQDKREGICVSVVTEKYPELAYTKLKTAQKRQLIAQNLADIPPVFGELERFAKSLGNGAASSPRTLSPDLQMMLLRPHHRLDASEERAVWLLLCRLQPLDVVRLYASDKNRFFAEYQRWSPAKKEWAITTICDKYTSQMQGKGGIL